MENLFRHRVLRLLLDEGKLRPERVKMLLGWKHSGFNLDASVRVGARDGRGRESISRYIIRAPFSAGKLRYLPGRNTVIYKTKLVKGLNRNFGLYKSLDFLAAATAHIPDEWEHLTRYYGYYSSVQRGKRIKAGLEERTGDQVLLADDSPGASAARRNWARFIKKIYEVDPLLCPECGGDMRIIAFTENQASTSGERTPCGQKEFLIGFPPFYGFCRRARPHGEKEIPIGNLNIYRNCVVSH